MIELPVLRPYQIEIANELRSALKDLRSVIACMPPGGGKTVLSKYILGSYMCRAKKENESGKCAFMVHRRGLVENASDSFNSYPSLHHGVIMSGIETSSDMALQVASIDTVNSWYVDKSSYKTDFTYDFLVFDEIHSQVSKFRTFLNAHNAKRAELGLSEPFVLGLSATPQHKELNKMFKRIVNGPAPAWLIENGYLSQFRYFQGTKGNLKLLKKSGDDYTEESVAAAMEGLTGDLIRDWKKLAEGRATIGFFPRRSQAQEAMQMLRDNGIDAYYVDGETDDEERRSLFSRLNNGDIQYICNVGVIERGTDIRRVGCVQLCTAIGSVVRYRQMVGRGSRVHPDVPDCIVLDHANNIRKHGFFEDDIAWTLEWGERPAKTHQPKATVECPQCAAVYRGGKCRSCGYEPVKKGLKSDNLEFSGGELKEVKKEKKEKKEKKKKTNEQMMISALYRASKKGATWGQAWFYAKTDAENQGTTFITPARFFIAGRWFKTIPYGDDNSTRKVRDLYGFTVGDWTRAGNPYQE
jgi:superfamily II DNA or RNA helicase